MEETQNDIELQHREECTNYSCLCQATQREGGGRIGRFEGDSVIPREYGITPLPENGPMGFVPTMVEDEDDNTFMFSVFDTDASLRDSIVAEISSRTIRCPLHNIHRNNNL